MKALVNRVYGTPDVLYLEEVDKPAPKDDEVLVKICAAAVNSADLHLLRADPFLVRLMAGGLLKPKFKVLGADIAGRVEAVGKNIKQFQPGEAVFGEISACGWGGFAEYVCASENVLALKPTNVSFEEAAAVPMAGITALQGLRDAGQVRAGQKVLIHGASGGVGTFAVQIAKMLGADVTAVCSSRNVDLVRSLGADHVIDYTREDFCRSGQGFDLIFAVNGNRSIFDYKRALNPGGTYIMVGGTNKQIFQALLLGPLVSIGGGKKLGSLTARINSKDLVILKELVEAGKVKPIIDRRYPLSEGAEALRYVGEGHARGKVIITMDSVQ